MHAYVVYHVNCSVQGLLDDQLRSQTPAFSAELQVTPNAAKQPRHTTAYINPELASIQPALSHPWSEGRDYLDPEDSILPLSLLLDRINAGSITAPLAGADS